MIVALLSPQKLKLHNNCLSHQSEEKKWRQGSSLMTYGHTNANPADLSDLNESHSTIDLGFSLQKVGNGYEVQFR